MKRYTLDCKEGSIPDEVCMRPSKDGEYVTYREYLILAHRMEGMANDLQAAEIEIRACRNILAEKEAVLRDLAETADKTIASLNG